MSKIFFDHLIKIEHIKYHIDSVATSHEEKTDLWNLVDEYINKKVLMLILEKLHADYHDEFMEMFLERPYDSEILKYLDQRLPCPFCDLIDEHMIRITEELEDILEIEPAKRKKPKSAKNSK